MARGSRGARARSLVPALLLLTACTRSTPPGGGPATAGAVPGSRSGATPAAIRAVLQVSGASFELAAPVEREVAVSDGKLVYLAGGLDVGGSSVSGVFALNPASGHLRALGTVPDPFHDAAGAMLGGRLYVFGGGASTSSDLVQAFDPSSGTGSVVARLPSPISDLGEATVDGTVYLVGGWDGSTYQRDILATSDGTTFRAVGQLPTGVRYPAVAGIAGGLVIAGGQTPGGTSSAVYRFDPTSGRITRIGSLRRPVAHASAFEMEGTVYVAGGRDPAGRPTRAVIAVDPSSGRTWAAGALPQPVSDAGVASDGTGTSWLLGGDRGRAVADVTRFQPASPSTTLPSAALPSAIAPTPLPATSSAPGKLSGAATARPFAGLLLIADRGNDRLLVVNPRGRVVWRYPDPSLPPPPVPFYYPDDAFWVHGGHAILVNEEENDVLTEIAYPSGRTLWTYGHPRAPGSGAGYVHQPDDLYPYPRGGVVVADAMNCRILFFDRRGDPSRQIGQTGNCSPGLPSTVGYPNGDTPLPNGHLLITELHGGSISEVRPDGHPLWTVHVPALDVPSDPQRLSDGTYVAANYSRPGTVVRFRSDGRVVWLHRPTAGTGMLDHPSLAAPLPNGLIAVTDDYRDRVVLLDPRTGRIVWQYGHTDVPGRSNGYLHLPDGLDLLLPDGLTPLHVDFASQRVRAGRP